MTAVAAPIAEPAQPTWFAQFFNPLLTPEGAGELLDETSRQALDALLLNGTLRAVNIALSTDTARTVRYWRWSCERHVCPAIKRALARHGEPSLETLLPHSRPSLWRLEVERFLACSDRHVLNLVEAGLLAARKDGSVKLVRIERASLLHFLRTRAIE